MPSNFWSGLCRRTTRVLNFPSGGFSSTVITLQIQSGRRPAKNVVMAENQALETKPLHDMRPCPSRDRKERYPQEPSHEAPQQHAASPMHLVATEVACAGSDILDGRGIVASESDSSIRKCGVELVHRIIRERPSRPQQCSRGRVHVKWCRPTARNKTVVLWSAMFQRLRPYRR